METFETEQINADSIPDGIRVNCPITNGMLRKMKRCFEGCEFCKGVIEPNPGHKQWSIRYRLICVHPVARQIYEVVED